MLGFWRRSRSRRREDDDDDNERDYSPFSGSPETSRQRVVARRVRTAGEQGIEDERSPALRGRQERESYFDRMQFQEEDDEEEEEQDDGNEDNEDEDAVDTPLLPIFSAAHLDRLPMYNITHAIRLLIIGRAETTLSWEQLRSPQISQFLVKPIQSQIRTNHFNRATICALIANCLQFQKEGQLQPGNVGVSKTRALISELLAMRLLKEFTTRELIDALSYDFDPLQGMSPPNSGRGTTGYNTPAQHDDRARGRNVRVSAIEIAIRAQAKRFLAHPLVVQHLEAIWAGTIVFHSEADNLHRKPERRRLEQSGYGTIQDHSPSALPADSVLSRKAHNTRTNKKPENQTTTRRSVTLYDPHDASLFKLSRLRVPRYRQVFSTISFAIMLALYVAVLYDRSLTITPLEVIFWFWSIGYMLDEVIGFTEQGFGLYILSFWNAFDLGILLLFVVYYILRLYGVVIADQGKHRIASAAYDALASTAILLFPRLFSVLDHYRYFSQLLIAFRMMAQDLVAILVLILISCSGFFIAFTLSFSDEKTDGNQVAYALFQILMGFTPAAWDKWGGYNVLGKGIMGAFLIICHFLIVTILITVLTNSFMAIVRNAEEEHQFLFAVNTISMVKSDALFSYIAPTNVIGWIASPLRFVMPFRQFVKFNRTIIKITHFPILLVIFTYERIYLSHIAFEPTDLVERPARGQSKPVAFSINKAPELFSPGNRLREPSVISFHKDRALDEVFRRPFKGSTMRTTTKDMDNERRNSTTVVDKWMQNADDQGGASPPMEQPRSVLDRLETRKPVFKRANTSNSRFSTARQGRDFSTATRSVASDPDLLSATAPRRPKRIDEEDETLDEVSEAVPQETDADGDDEINEESDNVTPGLGESAVSIREKENRTPADDSDDDDYFHTPTAARSPFPQLSSAARARLQDSPDILQIDSNTPYQAKSHAKRLQHSRNPSSGTILFAPTRLADDSSATRPVTRPSRPHTAKNTSSGNTGTATPIVNYANLNSGTRTPKPKATRARPIMPPRQQTAPNLTGFSFLDTARQARRAPSFNARALDLASEIGDNKFVGGGGDAFEGMPASFSEQFLREREFERRREEERKRSEDEEKGMVNRIMLARMHTLEEGFREVLKEIKGISSQKDTGSSKPSEGSTDNPRIRTKLENGSKVKRASPKKAGKRSGKGKEPERPGSGLREVDDVAGSGEVDAESPVSVIDTTRLGEGAEAGAGEERAATSQHGDE